ncbi:MAG: heme-binding protein [Rhodospirillales bacterium]|nr:heme-binding protein [Rhodospirillales bacterium]
MSAIQYAKILALAALVSTGAYAQDATFATRSLTPETALKASQAALNACRARGYQVAVAIVDRGGNTQVFLRDRFAGPHTVAAATDKAWTALTLRQDTLALAQLTAGGEMAGLRQFPRIVAVGGGLLIEGAGSIFGGIGVSGAPGGAADAECAKAGIDAIIDDISF